LKIAVVSQDQPHEFEIPKEGPWAYFFSTLVSLGHQIVPINQQVDLVIFMNNHSRLLRKLRSNQPKVQCVLVLWEPRVTRPANFIAKDLNLYDAIFSPSKDWVNGTKVKFFNWPQCKADLRKLDQKEWLRRSNIPVMFQANKFSFVRGENYSLRREIINVFGEELKVFGRDWNSIKLTSLNLLKGFYPVIRDFKQFDISLPKQIYVRAFNYCGFIPNKRNELRKSKFSIIVENSSDYVSEKIFESITTGSLVLYVGPDLESFGIPANIVVHCPNDANEIFRMYSEIIRDDRKYLTIVENAVKFHNSKDFYGFVNENVLSKLAEDICREVDVKRV